MILLLIHLYCWECQNLLRRHESATLVGWLRRHSQCLFGKSVALNNFWSSCWSGFCWISMDFLGFQPIWSAFSMGIVCHGPWYFGLGFFLRNSLEQHCPSVAWWLMRSTERCSIPTSMRRCATWGNRFSHHVTMSLLLGVFFLDVLFFMFIPGKNVTAFDMPKLPPSGTCCDPPRWGSERQGIAEGKQMMIRKYSKSDARKTPPWTGPRFLKFCFHLFEIEKQENDSKTCVSLSSMSYKT